MMKKLTPLLFSCLLLFNFSFAQEIEWQNTIGGSDGDFLRSIKQTADGGYILGGLSGSNISGDKTENCIGGLGDYDYWIVKADSLGNIQWQNTIGGSDYEFLYFIDQTSDGGYILAGNSQSNISGDKTENSWDNSDDYWIVKTDALGTIQWQNTIGGTGYDYLTSIQQTADSGYILGGYSNSNISGDKAENCIGNYDYWIVKVDSSGIVLWQNTIGGSSVDQLSSLQQTSDDGFILGGWSQSNISGDKTENSNGFLDYWIVKTDSIGNIQWQNTIGGFSGDFLNSIIQTIDGGFLLCGNSISSISGDKTENSLNNSDDYWIVKTDSTGMIQWQNTIGGDSTDYLYYVGQAQDGGYILGGTSRSNISGDKTENNLGPINSTDYWIVKTDDSGNIKWQNTIGGVEYEWLFSIQKTTDEGYILGGHSYSNISGDKTENCIGSDDYWLVKLSGKFNLISGKLFIDANSNNIYDIGENAVTNKIVTEINTGRVALPQQDGSYNVIVFNSGSFSVYPMSIDYYNTVPVMHNANFSSIHQTDSLNDFAFQPAGVFNDLCIDITPIGRFRASWNASYMINYENVGTTTLSPTVIFFPDNDVTFVSANPVANSVTVDSVVWNFGPLAPFQSGNILVTVNVNVGTPLGTLINSGVRIEPVAGDANTVCNYSYWEVLTTGSYDPNEILVDEDTLFSTQISNPPFLEYIIYFQNTGNDTAFNVKVLNPIDTFKLQLNSFEFVASSHPVNINYKIWERNMEFTFDNILLPDSNVNEPASHGFIRYRIKPKTTLVAGNSIPNTAYIYFDFNAPVQTNTAVTEIVQFTNISQWSIVNGQWSIYPNPASQTITISSSQMTNDPDSYRDQMTIYDLFGREVLQLSIVNRQSSIKIDVSGFSNGIYFLEINSGDGAYRAKFVKQ